ncbi:anchored repeat ABC transporter, substrate-binding protein [Corynebacterium epidermidicanis]|uniref:Anchored repeat ABC transporter, substrate-binding protein n=1 Tax=Corynebacterium epidermidicanis TaxID=1050174 RepID=A0A0G3GSE6_9CORY|nr:anchored repeat ABC transporter, substrate-binding protein [Corynebacterium epidermidicanis]AKK04096.1 anchored repeat ABC transporter, substrate-binding protein [Corynebacterium epidermidicanis]
MTISLRQLGSAVLLSAFASWSLGGCSTSAVPQRDDSTLDVVTTTPIIYDLAKNVAGDRARVTSLLPLGADPHSYEPTLRDVRNVANADLAFTNGLLLEQQSLLRTVESSVRPGTEIVPLAEEANRYGGNVIPLVEDVTLDSIWLGLRVLGDGTNLGATRASEVRLSVTGVRGPGTMTGFVTSTFGTPELFFNSADGFGDDSTTLPVDAHTHMSWSFSEAGQYELDVQATLDGTHPIAEETIVFAVGTPVEDSTLKVLDHGHEDITVDLNRASISVHGDAGDSDPHRTVISVPNHAVQQIPPTPEFRFLGRPGTEVFLLPQAVLGKHVHGELDPHLWHNVANAIAYVKIIRDELSTIDPAGASEYRANADRYLAQLADLDSYVAQQIASIPKQKRQLVTTHDGYRYLGAAYQLNIAGFVTPNPAVEASTRDLIALTHTLENLQVPAVFLEPQLARRATTLSETAGRLNIAVCRIYGDAFDPEVQTYLDLMRFNADSLRRCLGT